MFSQTMPQRASLIMSFCTRMSISEIQISKNGPKLGPKTLTVYLPQTFLSTLKPTFPSKCLEDGGLLVISRQMSPNASNSVSPVPSSLFPPFHPAPLPPRLLAWSASAIHPVAQVPCRGSSLTKASVRPDSPGIVQRMSTVLVK